MVTATISKVFDIPDDVEKMMDVYREDFRESRLFD
jgi:hypothetical protein